MSGAIATAVIGGVATAAAGALLSPDTEIPAPKDPTPAPQASQAPDANVVRQSQSGSGQGGGSPNVASTMLTGSGGVDNSLLKLGKNTLLGQ